MKLSRAKLRSLILETVFLKEADDDPKHQDKDVTSKFKLADSKTLANALTDSFLAQSAGGSNIKAPGIQFKLGNAKYTLGAKIETEDFKVKPYSSIAFYDKSKKSSLKISINGIDKMLKNPLKAKDKSKLKLAIKTAFKRGDITFEVGGEFKHLFDKETPEGIVTGIIKGKF